LVALATAATASAATASTTTAVLAWRGSCTRCVGVRETRAARWGSTRGCLRRAPSPVTVRTLRARDRVAALLSSRAAFAQRFASATSAPSGSAFARRARTTRAIAADAVPGPSDPSAQARRSCKRAGSTARG
jgi:hypothetical protein